LDAASRSRARIRGPFCDQHRSTDARHHSALRRDARIGRPPTTTKNGLVWAQPRMRNATQLLRAIGTASRTS
jgi:hypothetical protein